MAGNVECGHCIATSEGSVGKAYTPTKACSTKLHESLRQCKESLLKQIDPRRAAAAFVCSVVTPALGQRYTYSHAFTLLLAYDTSCHLYPFILLALEIFYILFQSYSHFCRPDRPVLLHAELYIDEGHFGPEELLPIVNNWINHTKEPEESPKLLYSTFRH